MLLSSYITTIFRGGAKELTGRVHKIFQGKRGDPKPKKFKIVPHFLHHKAPFLTQKAHFQTEIGPLLGQFFIGTGAMHPLLEIDGCKCTRCTHAAAELAIYNLYHVSDGFSTLQVKC